MTNNSKMIFWPMSKLASSPLLAASFSASWHWACIWCQVIWLSDLWRMQTWLSELWALTPAAETHLWPSDVSFTPDPDLAQLLMMDDSVPARRKSKLRIIHIPIACSQKMKYSPRSGFCWNNRSLCYSGQATQGGDGVIRNTMLGNP